MVSTTTINPAKSSSTTNTKAKRMDWQNSVIPKVQTLLRQYQQHSYRPTIRGTFYRLVSDNVIPNTYKVYKGLLQVLSTAREKKPGDKGYINVYAFADNTRTIVDIDDRFQSPQQFIEYYIDVLRFAGKYYFQSGYLTKWHNQPNYVEVMIEKNALRGAFTEILRGVDVRIVPNSGWSSKTYLRENIDRLLAHKRGRANNGEGPKEVMCFILGTMTQQD